MARNRQNLNIIYISDRMRETLRPIASCALTAVVAPMGYGKTTAVRWFLAEQAKAGAVVLQASIYSDNRSIFWKSVQKAFAAAGLTVLEGYDCPADASGAALLLEDLCAALGGKTPYYLFLDDFHLLGDERVAQFLCRWPTACPRTSTLSWPAATAFCPGSRWCGWGGGSTTSSRRPPPEPGGAAGLHPPLRRGDHQGQGPPGAHGPHRAGRPGLPHLVLQGYPLPDGPAAGHQPPHPGEGAVFRRLYRH